MIEIAISPEQPVAGQPVHIQVTGAPPKGRVYVSANVFPGGTPKRFVFRGETGDGDYTPIVPGYLAIWVDTDDNLANGFAAYRGVIVE